MVVLGEGPVRWQLLNVLFGRVPTVADEIGPLSTCRVGDETAGGGFAR